MPQDEDATVKKVLEVNCVSTKNDLRTTHSKRFLPHLSE